MSKYKAAVIGAGMIANAGHIPAYLKLSDDVELVAVCGHSMESAQKTARRWGIEKVLCDPEAMFRSCKIDIVSICTPNASHKVLSLLALKYGANVICEKPVAVTQADAIEMYAAAEKAGKLLVACQTQRFQQEYTDAREMIANKDLGEIIFCELSRIRRRGVPQWGSFTRRETNLGGSMCDIGVHMIDLLLWVLGSPDIISVSGMMSNLITRSETMLNSSLAESGAPQGIFDSVRTFSRTAFDVEDFCAGTIRLRSGVINFKVAWAANLPDTTTMTLMGSKCGLLLPEMLVYGGFAGKQADICLKRMPTHNRESFDKHFLLLENVVQYMKGQKELLIKPSESIQVASVLDAFYRSAEEGHEVLFSEL